MPENDVDRLWTMMKSIHLCMLANWDGERLRSRPMGAFVHREDNAIYFLADARRHKDEEMRRYPQVCVTFADTHAQQYISVSGRAEVSFDHAEIEALWSLPAKVWWDRPDDPNICVIKVTPEDAEFWDAHGTLVSYVKMAVAVVSGSHIDAGEHRKVRM